MVSTLECRQNYKKYDMRPNYISILQEFGGKSQSKKTASHLWYWSFVSKDQQKFMWLITRRKGILGSRNIICRGVMVSRGQDIRCNQSLCLGRGEGLAACAGCCWGPEPGCHLICWQQGHQQRASNQKWEPVRGLITPVVQT